MAQKSLKKSKTAFKKSHKTSKKIKPQNWPDLENSLSAFTRNSSISISVVAVVLALVASIFSLLDPRYEDKALAVTVQNQSAAITQINQNGMDFEVQFSTTGFSNSLSGSHTQFYFNNESSNATSKIYYGDGPYILNSSEITQGATQLCVIVGKIDNTVIADSGNCAVLPSVGVLGVTLSTPTITSGAISVGFITSNFVSATGGYHVNFYFDTEASSVTNKQFYTVSPFTFASTTIPNGATKLCAIVASGSNVVVPNSGNCVDLPQVTTPKSAAISSIVLNATDTAVTFTTSGFTNALNQTHTRFYFDTQSTSSTSNNYYSSGPYLIPISTIPLGATRLCVVVVSELDTVIANSGNCSTLPATTPPTNTNTGNTTPAPNQTTTQTPTSTPTSTPTTAQTSPSPFQINPTTLRLIAPLTSIKTSYEIGEALRFDVKGIKKSDGTPAANASCVFNFTFTPSPAGQTQTLKITKPTDAAGDCFVAFDKTGKVSFVPFAINTYAQTASAGSTTTLFGGNGSGSVQVSVIGADGSAYLTNSSSFTVGTIATGELARTGGLSVGVGFITAIMVAGLISLSTSKRLNTNKTKLK